MFINKEKLEGILCISRQKIYKILLFMMVLRVVEVSDNPFHFLMSRQKQSTQQIGALFLLIIAAVLLSIGEGSRKGSSSSKSDHILFYGIVPVLVASVLSGLASALCQWASQVINIFQFSGSNAKICGFASFPQLDLSFV